MRKEELNTYYLHGNPSTNKGGNPQGNSINFHEVEEITRPLSKYKKSQITLYVEIG